MLMLSWLQALPLKGAFFVQAPTSSIVITAKESFDFQTASALVF